MKSIAITSIKAIIINKQDIFDKLKYRFLILINCFNSNAHLSIYN